MMDEHMREIVENALENSSHLNIDDPLGITQKEGSQEPNTQVSLVNSSSYVLARHDSALSENVDSWLRGSTTDTRLQGGRMAQGHRSTVTRDSFGPVWYLLALVLPLFTNSSSAGWRCSPSAIFNTVELFARQLGCVCGRLRGHIRRLLRAQLSRDIFATMINVVLVVYAAGFLILSLYQASVFS
ncbi:uncharacterized protein LOC126974571 [Leptidea sinapis]|uniref:uncharacterized protein LOC126974571 n=1 Tax=Leptidea sinapis TaxID=189913 RepID=UPI00213871B1|nr:uncharacterized protein LOC126974571 [Leptidea sinapis]